MSLPKTIIVESRGCRFMISDKNDVVSNSLKFGEGWEVILQDISDLFLQDEPNGIVLDIGANVGSFSIPLAKKHSKIIFYLFEPQRDIYYQLCGNVFLNSFDNFRIFNFGLSNFETIKTFTMPNYHLEPNVGAFSLDDETRLNDYECSTVDGQQSIFIKKLDTFMINNIKLIKIDVEGMELEVLLGSSVTIKNNNYPPIIFESWTYKPWYQKKAKAVFDLLLSWGYNITVCGENNIAQHSSKQQININFIKEFKLSFKSLSGFDNDN